MNNKPLPKRHVTPAIRWFWFRKFRTGLGKYFPHQGIQEMDRRRSRALK